MIDGEITFKIGGDKTYSPRKDVDDLVVIVEHENSFSVIGETNNMNNGIWNAESAQHHQSSLKLAKWLAGYLPKRTAVIDFGCGNGYYVKYLLKECFGAVGVDGNADIDLKYPNFVKADLSEKFTTNGDYSIISLEVGEHIPKEGQEQFMQNLVNSCKKHLILSWASIGQPGIGHINCRDQKEVIADVESRGFKLNDAATKEARANVDPNCDWLERNLLVFERI